MKNALSAIILIRFCTDFKARVSTLEEDQQYIYTVSVCECAITVVIIFLRTDTLPTPGGSTNMVYDLGI